MIPSRLGGLCKGASGEHLAMAFFVAAVIFTGAAKRDAPWTTRWPMASTSLRDFTTPHAASHRTSITALIAATWLAIGISFTTFSAPAFEYTRREPAMPMRSTRPLQSIFSPCMSNSMYLSDDEPAFTTRTFFIVD